MKTPRGTKFKEYDMKTANISMEKYIKEASEDQLGIVKKLYDRKMSFLNHPVVLPWLKEIESTVSDEIMWFVSVDERYDDVLKEVVMTLRVSFMPDTEELAEQIRSKVQLSLHQVAMREVNSITGSVYYVFKKDLQYEDPAPMFEQFKVKQGSLRVTIDHASLAPKCEVVKKTELITKYVVECEQS